MDPWHTQHETPLPARPFLKPWYRQVACSDGLVLEHGQSALSFQGRAAQQFLPALFPLLDGTRTTAQIVAEVGSAAEPAVAQALRLLAARRLLLEGEEDAAGREPSPALVSTTAGFIASIAHDANPGSVHATLADAVVDVVGAAPVAGRIVQLLHESGVGNAARGDWSRSGTVSNDHFTLVVPGPYEIGEIAAWNRAALADGTAWLQVLPFDGRFAAIGPLYIPGETCCYECYMRRRAAASGYAPLFDAIESTPLQAPSPPAIDALVAGVASLLALRWIAYRDHFLPGVFYACEESGTALTQHRVHRVPRCLACSGLRETAPPLPWFKEVGVEQS